jgi:hypothetical protein
VASDFLPDGVDTALQSRHVTVVLKNELGVPQAFFVSYLRAYPARYVLRRDSLRCQPGRHVMPR